MEAISQAAAEITAEMPSGGVDVRLDGRDLDFVVHAPSNVPAPPAPPPRRCSARTTRRAAWPGSRCGSPSPSRPRPRSAAAKSGQSLNTWLVNVVRAATRDGAINVDIDLSSIPFFGGDPFGGGKQRGNRRMTGWV